MLIILLQLLFPYDHLHTNLVYVYSQQQEVVQPLFAVLQDEGWMMELLLE